MKGNRQQVKQLRSLQHVFITTVYGLHFHVQRIVYADTFYLIRLTMNRKKTYTKLKVTTQLYEHTRVFSSMLKLGIVHLT